jgi:beta-lactamase regulating signal transducer with metallopeptidase domain
MTVLNAFLPPAVAEQIGWTLVHFVWQGALVAILLEAVLLAMRRRSAAARYVACSTAMVLMVCCAAATFVSLNHSSAAPAAPAFAQPALPASGVSPALSPAPLSSGAAQAQPAPQPPAQAPWGAALYGTLCANVPLIAAAWALCVLVLSLRLIAGLAGVRRLRSSGVTFAAAALCERAARISARLRVKRPVRVLQSSLARAPLAIGWLRPVILIPAGAVTGLAGDQIEALLAHELAHIRRHDYLVNLLQTVVETLLFYHPAVHWVSRRMRIERERCCDDAAVAACGDARLYAKALADMAGICALESSLAMAAGGGSLVNRIRRVLGLREERQYAPWRWVAGATIAAAVMILALSAVIPQGGAFGEAIAAKPAATPGAANTVDSTGAAPVGQPAIESTAPANTTRLMGAVLDENGKPAVGAQVTAYQTEMPWLAGADPVSVETRTGAGGWFALNLPVRMPSDAWLIIAKTPALGGEAVQFENGKWRQYEKPERKTLAIRTHGPMGSIAGTVVDAEGRPVADAAVSIAIISVKDGGGINTNGFPGAAVRLGAHTDAAGRFAVAGLPPGWVTVAVAARGLAQTSQNYTVGGDENTVVMLPEGRISGRVVAPDPGLDGWGISVVAFLPDQVQRAMTSADGTFTIAGLQDGDFELDALPPQDDSWGRVTPLKVHVATGETAHADIDISRTVTVSGKVISKKTNAGVAGVMVQVMYKDFNRLGPVLAETDAEGHYSVKLAPGHYILLYARPGRNGDVIEVSVEPGKDLPDVILDE